MVMVSLLITFNDYDQLDQLEATMKNCILF